MSFWDGLNTTETFVFHDRSPCCPLNHSKQTKMLISIQKSTSTPQRVEVLIPRLLLVKTTFTNGFLDRLAGLFKGLNFNVIIRETGKKSNL